MRAITTVTSGFSGASGLGIAAATALLFAVSWLFFPQSVSASGISGMLPFAAILVLVALGQTLVVQQGGVDLSVPGIISLAGVILAYGPDGATATWLHAWIALGVALAVGLASGLLSGLLVTRLAVAPIVATLGLNTLLYGFNMEISGGTPGSAVWPVVSFANIKIFGLTLLIYIAVAATLCVILIVKKTAVGRRFEIAGASSRVGRAAGISVEHYQLSAYLASGGLSAAAGVLLAGIMQSPSAFQGNTYLMSSIAAVVLGGTSLLGGVGNFAATAVAAVFLSQLQLLVLTSGASIGVQYLFQGLAIVIGVAIYSVDLSKHLRPKAA